MRIGSIRMLRHFIAASQFRNLHRAAESQSITQSAITKSIQQLEEGLGVQLFERSTKGVSLTSYGHALQVRAKKVELECDLIERELSEMAAGNAGHLTIGAGSVWASVFLPAVVSQLHNERPSAEFNVLRSTGARFVEQLNNQKIDVGLGAIDTFAQDSRLTEEFVCEPLSEITTSFFAHQDHPIHKVKAITAEDICSYPSAIFRLDQELQNKVAAFFSLRDLKQPHPALTTDSISGIMQTLRVSNMITCLPSQLSEIAHSFEVEPISFDQSPWTFRSGIIYRKTSAQYPLLRQLVCALQAVPN